MLCRGVTADALSFHVGQPFPVENLSLFLDQLRPLVESYRMQHLNIVEASVAIKSGPVLNKSIKFQSPTLLRFFSDVQQLVSPVHRTLVRDTFTSHLYHHDQHDPGHTDTLRTLSTQYALFGTQAHEGLAQTLNSIKWFAFSLI
jgi:hypothetical protein